MTLLICQTCPRFDSRRTGQFARDFRAALDETLAGRGDRIATRSVQCLGGCPADGVVALDGFGKARVRFTALSEDRVDAVVEAAIGYDACASGHPDDWVVPVELAGNLSSVTVKRVLPAANR